MTYMDEQNYPSSGNPQTIHRTPILVTGAHRTGTTWVGKMLAANNATAYISEPTNALHRPGVMRAATQNWYAYICAQNEELFLPAVNETLRFHYHPLLEILSLRSVKDLLRMGRDSAIFLRGWLFKQRPLLKDPFAVFSAPWFARQLNCQVVITIRHPAAFASSLKRLNWPFDFNDLLAQPLLMQDWLEPFREDMEKMVLAPQDIIAQSSLLWRIIYQVVADYRKQHPQFIVVRHEDLSLDSLGSYRTLYTELGLPFTPAVENAILTSSSSDNPKEGSKRSIYTVRLDSQANLHNWKRRLTPEEIRRVRQLTEEIACQYYPELSWD